MATSWQDRRFLGILLILLGAVNGALEVFGGRYERRGLLIAATLLVIGTYMVVSHGRKT